MAYDENIRIIAEDLERVKNQMKDIGSDIPDYDSEDAGKILSVDSSGELEWRDETTELPEYSESEENKVLSVNSSGELEWKEESTYTPPAYSTTEFNTGVKWIDGKDIYCRCVPLSELSTNIFQNPAVTTLTGVNYIDTLIYGAVTGTHASTGIKYVIPLEISLATDGTLKTGDPFETVNFVNGSAYFIMQYTKVTSSKSKKGGK